MQNPKSEASVIIQLILSEDVLTLEQARGELAAFLGKRPDKSTVYRWCLKGVGGNKLESTRIGGRIITSKQALTRFIAASQTHDKKATD